MSKTNPTGGKERLVFGVGRLDVHPVIINGVRTRAYRVWFSMLKRCYGKGSSYRRDYEGCSVDPHWHKFSNFKDFYDKFYFEGAELDKDLLILGNKVYSKEKCVFIPQWLNTFITIRTDKASPYPIGVTAASKSKKYQAAIKFNGENRHLGLFSDPYDAHLAWYKAKMDIAYGYKSICDSLHPELYNGLIIKIKSLKLIHQ